MESLHYLLMKSHAVFARRVLAEVSKLGLTSGQPKILDYLYQHGEADQKTIAAHCEIEPATAGSILLRMESAGLVLRRQKEGNRRSLYVSLTPAGRQAAARLMEIFHQVEGEATAALSQEEAQTLQRLLTRLCDAMQAHPERGTM